MACSDVGFLHSNGGLVGNSDDDAELISNNNMLHAT